MRFWDFIYKPENKKMIETFDIKNKIVLKINQVINIALEYERYFDYERKLGITGEIGEILACFYFDLKLVKNNRNEGFDAIDENQNRIQIKSVRKEPKKGDKTNLRAGRTSRFSEHEFDYCLLLLFNQKYELKEVWKANFKELKNAIEKQKRRNPSIKEFIKYAKQVEIPKKKVSI